MRVVDFLGRVRAVPAGRGYNNTVMTLHCETIDSARYQSHILYTIYNTTRRTRIFQHMKTWKPATAASAAAA